MPYNTSTFLIFNVTLEKVEAPDLATRVKWFEERDYYCPLPLSKSPGIVQNDGWN